MTKKELNQIVKIAQENIISMENRSDLEQHFSDEEDFFEISVWGVKGRPRCGIRTWKEKQIRSLAL